MIVLRQKPAVVGRPVNLLGFVEEIRDGRRCPLPTSRRITRSSTWAGRYAHAFGPPAVRVPVPRPARRQSSKTLQRHGIAVEELA